MTYEIIVLSTPDVLFFFCCAAASLSPFSACVHTHAHTPLDDDICMLPSMEVLIQKKWGDKYVTGKHPQNRRVDGWMDAYWYKL